MGARLEGVADVVSMIDGVQSRMFAPEPVLAREAARIEEMIHGSFASGRSPDGRAWPPRKTVSADRVHRNGRPRSTRRTGRTGQLERETSARAEGRSLIVESRAPYAGFVQAKRPFLPFEPGTLEPMAMLADMDARIADWIVEGDR